MSLHGHRRGTIRKGIESAFLALAIGGAAIETSLGAERPLSLDDAIGLALQKNEAIFIERESRAAADANVRQARGAYDPLLEIDGGWRRSSLPFNSALTGAPAGELAPTNEIAEGGVSVRQLLPTGGTLALSGRAAREETDDSLALLSPAYDSRVGVELRQPLLRGRSVDPARLSIRVAKADRDRTMASLRQTVAETVASVEVAYWALVEARLAATVREEAVSLAEEQLEETRARIESGAVPETEVAQPRAELERRRVELLESREFASRAENRLKILTLGESDQAAWEEVLVPVEDAAMPVLPVDVAASLEQATADRPELDVAEAVVKRRKEEGTFARDGVWPSLDAVLSYDRFGLAGSANPDGSVDEIPPKLDGDLGQSFETLSDGDFDDARVALVLGFPLGNRAARGAKAAARSFERQAEAALARVRKVVRAEVLDAAAALESAGQRIEASRAGREAAEVQFGAERDRYSAGLSTNFLVLTRQNDLSRARLDEISALTDYRTASTEMARATGSLIADRGIEIDGEEETP